MRPIIRLMMRHGIVLQSFQELVKSVYTEEAEKEIRAGGTTVTDLQISLMTGLHRKEVKRFRDEGYDTFLMSPTLSTGADVVTRWLTDPRFQNARREPRALSIRKGEEGNGFAELVRSIYPELRPTSILNEMVRLGVVQVDEMEAHLTVDAFVPRHGFEAQIQYLAENGHDHLAAAVHNLSMPVAPMLEQSVSASELSAVSAGELEQFARSQWKHVMQQLVERALVLEARDKAGGDTGTRINFGIYLYKESQPDEPGPGSKQKRAPEVAGPKRRLR
jgi:hypothetical protein